MTGDHIILPLALLGILSLSTAFGAWVAMDHQWAGWGIFIGMTAAGVALIHHAYKAKGEVK